ncbi:alpha/beta hydrolase [Tenacibaculum sp. E3R01]|uniref:alpha/beta fold hydrolase n=1 Tax=Tenacibaculum sp. E3R01 TaxID=2267227 RepID=UPI000DEA5161|nr:alpha/beta hydrolase [Tenacibaculum sp. E3R01]RBW59344.1 alpha/beta hydrolase [Tenacibaculum sp. E3R01]
MIVVYKGVNIFYTEKGIGSAVVLLHGFLENSTMWNGLVEEISKRNRVIAIDLLGHGKSDCLGYVHTMEDMAEAVKQVLTHLRIRKAIFVGHSMGGYVSLVFANKYLKNVKGICLMNSTAQADDDERKEIREKANKIVRKNFNMMVKMAINNLFASTSKELFSNEIEKVLNEALKTPVRGYMASNEGMRLRKNSEEVLEQIQKRIIIAGKEDPVLNYESIKREAIRTNTDLKVLANGHMSHIENKKELLETLLEFIRS